MKRNAISVIIPITLILTFSVAFAMSHNAAERGKALFENPNFAGGKKACSSCHPKGKGLSTAGLKSEFSIMGKKQNSLEQAINFFQMPDIEEYEKCSECLSIIDYLKNN